MIRLIIDLAKYDYEELIYDFYFLFKFYGIMGDVSFQSKSKRKSRHAIGMPINRMALIIYAKYPLECLELTLGHSYPCQEMLISPVK